jgi:signal transduction histidine kinase
VIDLEMVQIEEKGLMLHWTPSKEAIAVQIDPAKLKQVAINVIGNAVKFTDAGSITIAIQIKAATEPNNNNSSWAIVSVTDTGIGIPPEQQQKLFRPFVMADGSRTRKHGGTGLGLAISRKLMELMGGTISLYSPGVNKGTTIEIALPLISSSRLPVQSESDRNSNDGNSISVNELNGHSNITVSQTDPTVTSEQ